MFLFVLSLRIRASIANPSWALYVEILGLDIFFFSGVTFLFSSVIERKPKRLFKEGAVLVALSLLSYMLASWVIKGFPLEDDHPLTAWSIFSFSKGFWTYGLDFLLIGIAVSCLEGFEMIVLSGARALKGWIKKLNVDNVNPTSDALN